MKLGNIGILAAVLALTAGCASQQASRPGPSAMEQALVSGAIDRALDKIDLTPLQKKNVFLETKYLEDANKNYVIVSLHLRLLNQGTMMAESAEKADVVLEVASGGIGTNKAKANPEADADSGKKVESELNATAKLVVVAYEAQSKKPVIKSGTAVAKVDRSILNIFDMKETDMSADAIVEVARRAFDTAAQVVPASLRTEKKETKPAAKPEKPAPPDVLLEPAVKEAAAPTAPLLLTPKPEATPAAPAAESPSPLSGNAGFPGFLPPTK